MATLSQTAYYTRKAVNLAIVGLIGFFVLRFAFYTAKDIWRQFRPEPPPPPNMAFGKLPKIKFPEQKDLPQLTFKLETIEGGLPSLDQVSRVYFVLQKGPSLLDLDRAKERAKGMGFIGEPEPISEILYRWQTSAELATTLEMNINTTNFHLRYPYEEDSTLLTNKILLSNEQAAEEAKSFLKNNQYLSDDLVEGRTEFAYYRLVAPNLISALSLSEADFIRVNLFPANLNEMKVMSPDPQNALISFLFSGTRERGRRIVEVKYTHSPVERESFATYPLKTPTMAWQELQGNQGYIASLGESEDGKITIRQVYLAYYDSGEEQNFLQPIFVFEGDKNFFGYVPAVSSQWVE